MAAMTQDEMQAWLAQQGATAGRTAPTNPQKASQGIGIQPLSFTPPAQPTTNNTSGTPNNWSYPQGTNAKIKKPDGTEVPNPFGLSAEQIYWALSGDPRAAEQLKTSLGGKNDNPLFHQIINYYESGGGGFNGGGYTHEDAARASMNYSNSLSKHDDPYYLPGGAGYGGEAAKALGYPGPNSNPPPPPPPGGNNNPPPPPAGNGLPGGNPPPAGGYPTGPAPGAANQNQLVQQLLRAIGLTPRGGLYNGQPQGGPYGTGNAPYNTTPIPTGMPKNPRNYTGMPMRAFDPSWLVNSMRNYYQGGVTTGKPPYSANSMPGGWQGNNVNNWASIYQRG